MYTCKYRDLWLPVDLILGQPEEEPPALAIDYTLELVHQFARPGSTIHMERKDYYSIPGKVSMSLSKINGLVLLDLVPLIVHRNRLWLYSRNAAPTWISVIDFP